MVNDILNIYSEELKVKGLKESDNFFDFGGHSLIMAIIQMRLKTELNIEVPMETLFTHLTVKSLSEHI